MRKINLILLTMAMGIYCNAQVTLNNDLLANNEFHYYGEMFGYNISFTKDGNYKFDFGYEGPSWSEFGKYKIVNNEVLLSYINTEYNNFGMDKDRDTVLGNATMRIISTPDDLYYTHYVELKTAGSKKIYGFENECSCLPFAADIAVVPSGSSRKIGDIPVITVGMRSAVTTDNVKIRDKPSKNGKALTYFEYFSELGDLPSVPKGTSLTAIARTTTKEKIDKYEDYWYYINVGAKSGVWMYGAFINLNYVPKEE